MGSVHLMLEELARKYAKRAVELDRKGMVEDAIAYYRRAIEALSKLVSLDPGSPFSSVYLARIRDYERRIQELEKEAVGVSVLGGESSGIEEILLSKRPEVYWEDIADLEEAKNAIKEAIVYPIKRPDLFPLGWPRGILLFGPPGCGKTLLAAAVATEVDAVFLYVDAATIMSKWLGEAEKNVARLFRIGREYASMGKPTIIFIDEVDALFGTYSTEVGGEVRVRNQFLKEMDGLQDKKMRLHLYVIGATNKPWKLDEAFIRRFQKRIYVPLPNTKARLELFIMYTRSLKLSDDVDLKRLAELTEGYTASDIRDLCLDVQNRVVREFFESGVSGEPRPIRMDDFLEAIHRRKPSVNRRLVEYYEMWAREFGAS